MIYRFGPFELDTAQAELREDAQRHALEPQVFAVLALLVENRERLVSKDEIVETVWDGRAVSDSAIASRVKAARRALRDDGKSQRYIRTIHRRGFRFVAEVASGPVRAVAESTSIAVTGDDPGIAAVIGERPSIAVLPFALGGECSRYPALGDALAHELIAELARLHWLFVTARGSSFRFRSPDADVVGIGRMLGVRYVLCGAADISGMHLAVTVELADTRDGRVLWADRFAGAVGDVHAIRAAIGARVLSELEIRIPLHEAARARLVGTEQLDAWAAYHLGLQHMFRFNRADNTAARTLFDRAIALDPAFARAHAGLSFVHFQSAFLRHSDDVAAEAAAARRSAERGLELDPLDPFVNFTMGRSYWLHGDLEGSLGWLERATHISPSYAQGIYARAWTEALAGRPLDSRLHVDLAMRLSPLDPMHYAMLATRAFTHMALGEHPAAAEWAERAARSPGAHVLIAMIAAAAHAIDGNRVRATAWAASARERNPALGRSDFFRAFPIAVQDMRERMSTALMGLGF
jgi:TolB-like protein/tetratricopeptide (TPR) repeat protein